MPSPSGLQQLYLLAIDGGIKRTRAGLISQNYKSNVLANILRVMTGIPAVESSSLDASAISESGMSICCATLLDPSLLPAGKAPFCLIPGHIQKDGALFREVYDLDSKLGMRLGEDAVMKLTFDEKLRIITSIRQSKSGPELLVKETIEGQRLQANYSWQYELFNNYMPKDHHRSAPKSSRMLVTAFGSADLQRRIFEDVLLPRCGRKQLNVVVPGDKSYSGTCCRIMEDIQMQMDPSSTSLPRPGDWILLDIGKCRQPGVYDGEEFPTKVYLGSIIELYTLLCNREPGKNLKLARTSNCLFCTCGWEARTIILASDRMETAPTERVFADDINDITVIEPADQEAQTVNHVDTGDCNHQGVNGTASPPPQSPRPKTRSAKRKNARETRGSRKRKGASK